MLEQYDYDYSHVYAVRFLPQTIYYDTASYTDQHIHDIVLLLYSTEGLTAQLTM